MRNEVRVAITDVGNCASSLVHGVDSYRNADPGDFVPGLIRIDLGGYYIKDIELTAAFDVDREPIRHSSRRRRGGSSVPHCHPAVESSAD